MYSGVLISAGYVLRTEDETPTLRVQVLPVTGPWVRFEYQKTMNKDYLDP